MDRQERWVVMDSAWLEWVLGYDLGNLAGPEDFVSFFVALRAFDFEDVLGGGFGKINHKIVC